VKKMDNMTYQHRDLQCASEVGRMAELGRFGTEFVVYGSCVQEKDGKIYYFATSEEEKLYDYVQQEILKDTYFTPITRLSLRSQVPAGMRDELLLNIKFNLLKQLKKDYECSNYFSLMQPFFQMEANDIARNLLEMYQEQIDGHFNDRDLQLFLGTAQMACRAKILRTQTYQALQHWHDTMRRQMEDDPIAENNLNRTFYGFVYQDPEGHQGCVFNARKMDVVHQYHTKLVQGGLLGPIIKKQYWFSQFSQLPEIRATYREWLLAGQNRVYFQILQALNRCVGVIDPIALQNVKKELAYNHVASQAVAYYAAMWNTQ